MSATLLTKMTQGAAYTGGGLLAGGTVAGGGALLASGHVKEHGADGWLGNFFEWINRVPGEGGARAAVAVGFEKFYAIVENLGKLVAHATGGRLGTGLANWGREGQGLPPLDFSSGTPREITPPSGDIREASFPMAVPAAAAGVGLMAARQATRSASENPGIFGRIGNGLGKVGGLIFGKTALGRMTRLGVAGGAAYSLSDGVRGTINTLASDIASEGQNIASGNFSWEDAEYKGSIVGHGVGKGLVEIPTIAGHFVDAGKWLTNKAGLTDAQWDASQWTRDGLRGLFQLKTVDEIAQNYQRTPSTLDRGIDLAAQFGGAAVGGGAIAGTASKLGYVPAFLAKHVPILGMGN